MRARIRKNGVELSFEGEKAEAAFISSIVFNSRTPYEALHILELIQRLLRCDAPEVLAKGRRFRIRVVRAG